MTPAALLVEHKLGRDLITYLDALQAAGQSWRQIARHIREETGVVVSHESLRCWHLDLSTPRAA
jgi:hypothetical protein